MVNNPMRAFAEKVNILSSLTGARILEMVYAYKAEPSGSDPLIDLADLSTTQFSEAVQPGKWAVDSFPICEYLPRFPPVAKCILLTSAQ